MAKFYGTIGFVRTVDDGHGVYLPVEEEIAYVGDLTRNNKRWTKPDSVNAEITMSNEISIVADDYILENHLSELYVEGYDFNMIQFAKQHDDEISPNPNNFNFDTRNKCNRCQAIKMPKLKEEIFKKKDKKNKKKVKERKTDWLCLNCKNLNYGFRKNCNRCKIERQDDFPAIYLEPNQKINDTNNKIVLMNNYEKIKDNLNNVNNNFANSMNMYQNNNNIFSYTNYYNNNQNN